jgi:hypothetical protein
MKTQINLRLPEDMRKMVEKYAKLHGYKNIQELAKIAIREKIMGKNYDESFASKEIELIDRLIDLSIAKSKLVGEEELMKALK